MQTPRMLGTVRAAAPALADAGVGVGVAVLVLVAGAAGVGPQWIGSPRPLDAVAVGLVGVVAGALALRRRYPVAVRVVLNVLPGDRHVIVYERAKPYDDPDDPEG